jgi:hypothetical protein
LGKGSEIADSFYPVGAIAGDELADVFDVVAK